MNPTQLEAENFDLQQYLKALCKKQHHYEDDTQRETPEIDFLMLQKDLQRLQGIQERTCEQIVEFVDQHRQRFIEINDQLDLIEDKVASSENILKLLSSQIDEYKAGCFLNESKIQKYITDYEIKLMQEQMISLARTEAVFISKLNAQFQSITSKEAGSLSVTQKYLISRFTFKYQYFRAVFSHQIVNDFIPETIKILQIVTNIFEQFQFYLSEQLARYQNLISLNKQQAEKGKIIHVLNQIKAWYININKKQEYYKVLQKNTIEKQMQIAEKLFLSHKTTLLSGKDVQIIQNSLLKIFNSLSQFPEDYPKERIKSLLFSFFRKEELKFLYTYAMPIFPLAYTAYLSAISSSNTLSWVKDQLKEKHGWNLRMWVMVRQKNILDRSNNDNDLFKWIDIVFKQNCMLPGTLTDFVKLTFKILNRYFQKIAKSQFSSTSFNKLVDQAEKIGPIVAQKIIDNSKGMEQLANKICVNIKNEFHKILGEIMSRSLGNVAITCHNFFEPVKTFVSKIIKKDKDFVQNNIVNKHENIFRPLQSFIKNNIELSPQSLQIINEFVQQAIVKYYDSKYAAQIYSYSKDQLISEQVSLVMEVVGRERTTLFKQSKQN